MLDGDQVSGKSSPCKDTVPSTKIHFNLFCCTVLPHSLTGVSLLKQFFYSNVLFCVPIKCSLIDQTFWPFWLSVLPWRKKKIKKKKSKTLDITGTQWGKAWSTIHKLYWREIRNFKKPTNQPKIQQTKKPKKQHKTKTTLKNLY